MALKIPVSSSDPVEMERLQVEAELDRILQSAGFRTSKRSQEFLRYIVTTALDGRFDALKERVIGHVIFHRLPDYDTGEHSIVRVKANELRKRLAQFYGETSELSAVQIHLPRGSYTPEFRWMDPPTPSALLVASPELFKPIVLPEPSESKPATPFRLRFLAIGLAAVATLFLCWYFLQGTRNAGIEEQFWKPILQDASAPIICIADPEVLKLADTYNTLAFNGTLPESIPATALIRDSGHYVGWGDALALTNLTTFFALHHKDPEIRMGNDVSFPELSRAPVILVGARSNPWTMQLANNLRFVFERTATESFIRDKSSPTKTWRFELGPPKVDYIVISRVFESKTGRMVVLAAGLSHFGTQMAGQILTNPAYLSKALSGAPKDWQTRNIQLVFRVEVFGNTAGAPVLEASTYW